MVALAVVCEGFYGGVRSLIRSYVNVGMVVVGMVS